MSPIIQAKYDDLDAISAQFREEEARSRRVYAALEARLTRLRRSGWVAEAADIFYNDCERDVLPAVQRLVEALASGFETIRQIKTIYQEAEEEAANHLRSDPASANADSPAHAKRDPVDAVLAKEIGTNASFQTGKDDYRLQGDPPPDTAAERSDVYDEWNDTLAQQSSPANGITFFGAASSVTRLLGLTENTDLLITLASIGLGTPNERTNDFLDRLGEFLFTNNAPITKES